jgi:FxsC-like protein
MVSQRGGEGPGGPGAAGSGEGAQMDSRDGVRPYFFLSYARTPKRDPGDKEDPDRWVHRLYKDLCSAILQMTDAQPNEAGFMDRETQLGDEWPPRLGQALATCRVFVPLYSRRFFESDYCGKEWCAFANREVNQNAREDDRASAIVPALWTGLSQYQLPDVAQQIQYNHADLGPRYTAEGFYGIMKLQKYRSDYALAVHRLAQRIVQVADETALPAERPADFVALQSTFGPASAKRSAADQLQIAVLAHDNLSLPPGRDAHYYGSTPRAWGPYRPEYQQPLADYARELARKCLGCQPLVGTFDELLSRASNGAPVPPSLFLVDAWVALSPAHQERLRRLDELDQSWVSVLVPWNILDAGLASAESDLRSGLEQLLGRRLASVPRRCELAAVGIPTLQEFGQLLAEMTLIMLKRFRRDTPAFPPDGPPIQRPRLRGPGPNDPGGPR